MELGAWGIIQLAANSRQRAGKRYLVYKIIPASCELSAAI